MPVNTAGISMLFAKVSFQGTPRIQRLKNNIGQLFVGIIYLKYLGSFMLKGPLDLPSVFMSIRHLSVSKQTERHATWAYSILITPDM